MCGIFSNWPQNSPPASLALVDSSNDLISALGAELGSGFEFRTALGAFVLGAQRLTAFRTEFCPLCMRATTGTKRGRLFGQVQSFGQVLFLKLLLHLIDCGLYLRGGHFGFNVGSALIAEGTLWVPARSLAYPMGTLGTLPEIGLGFFDGFAKSFVVGWALDGTLNFISVRTGPSQDAAE